MSVATALRLAPSAQHFFFLAGEPELADRYFPWLVNLMSPAYWVFLFTAVQKSYLVESSENNWVCSASLSDKFGHAFL
jgi:hypothetical protein